MGGTPVKLTWPRDDDLQSSYYHTVSVERLEAGLDAQGKPVAWLHRTVEPTIGSTFDAAAQNQAPFELGMTAINMPFVIPNVRIENPEALGPHPHRLVPLGLEHPPRLRRPVLRRRAGDELIGPPRRIDTRTQGDPWNYGESPERDPLDTGRLRRVVEIAAREANWGRALPKGRGQGIAVAYQCSFGEAGGTAASRLVAATVEPAFANEGHVPGTASPVDLSDVNEAISRLLPPAGGGGRGYSDLWAIGCLAAS
jgi:isoquinoline 1-oxidoreductase beta subunit